MKTQNLILLIGTTVYIFINYEISHLMLRLVPKMTIQISPEIKGIKSIAAIHEYSSILGNTTDQHMATMIQHNERRTQAAQGARGTQSDKKRSNSKSIF